MWTEPARGASRQSEQRQSGVDRGGSHDDALSCPPAQTRLHHTSAWQRRCPLLLSSSVPPFVGRCLCPSSVVAMALAALDAITGYSMGVAGVGASSQDLSLSTKIRTDSGERRKLVAGIVTWMQAHRGTAAKPFHTLDDVLKGALAAACEKTTPDPTAEGGFRTLSAMEQSQLVDHRYASLTQEDRATLFRDLKANLKVLVGDAGGEMLSYRATHVGLYTKEDLDRYIQKFTHGIPAEELADAYPGVAADIDELLLGGSVYEIKFLEKNRRILFPTLREFEVKVDQDLREMWQSVAMPKSIVDLEEKLHAAGHLSEAQYKAGHLEKSRQMQLAIKLAAGQKLNDGAERRAKRRRYPNKVTNTHLVGQFAWFTPAATGSKAPAPALVPK